MISQNVTYGGELHKRIVDNVRERVRAAKITHEKRINLWRQSENTMLAAIPLSDVDLQRKQDRENKGRQSYTTIQIPYTYAAVMAAYSYLSTVFLGRSPVHQFGGRHGESEQQTQALEALIAYQVQVGKHMPAYYTALYDAPKYGECVMGVYWRSEERIVAEIVEETETYLGIPIAGAAPKKVKRSRRLKGYEGNKVFNISPTRFMTDPRKPRRDFQAGEFCIVQGTISWNNIVRGVAKGQYINKDFIRAKSRGGRDSMGVGVEMDDARYLETSALERPDPTVFGSNTIENASDEISYYEVYIELIPSEWKLGSSDMPEKWVFSVTQDYRVCFEARPCGYWHDKFPFVIAPVEPEAYGLYTRNFVEILEPVQQTLDWLVNSHFYNVRAALNNKFVFDPSKIVTSDLERSDPGAAIRLKPSAYGTDPRLALHQLQVQDVTRAHLNDMQMMYDMGERLGFNDQVLGVGAPTSRRSATEIRSTGTFGVGRLKTTAEHLSVTGWTEMQEMLVANSQQFYNQAMKFRIVGDLAMTSGQKFMTVTPDDIAGFFDPVLIDGTLPADRYAQGNIWRELMAQASQIPDVAMQYDMGKIFAWVAQLMGIKNITQFQRMAAPQVQVLPDDVIANNVAKGNVIPLMGGPSPGQVSGMGATG